MSNHTAEFAQVFNDRNAILNQIEDMNVAIALADDEMILHFTVIARDILTERVEKLNIRIAELIETGAPKQSTRTITHLGIGVK